MKAIHETVDVLVVGAGPVGLFCANELERFGLNSRIIDKKASIDTSTKVLGVSISTLSMLQDKKLIHSLLDQGQPLNGLILKSKKEVLAKIPFQDADSHHRLLIDLSKEESEFLFYQKLQKQGKEVEWNNEIVAIEQDVDGVNVQLKQKDGTTISVKAKYVIACDGAHSMVRQFLKGEFVGAHYDQTWWVADLYIKWTLANDQMVVYASSKGPLACFPLGNHRYRIILAAETTISSPTIEDMVRAFKERSGDEAELYNPAWISTFVIHHGQIKHYRKGRVFFCGDAAHLHSPIGNQRLNSGLSDVSNLIWKLSMVDKGLAKESLLDSYHEERFFINSKILEKTDAMTKLMLVRNPLLKLVRNQMVKFLTCFAGARQYMANFLLDSQLSYPHSAYIKTKGKKVGFKAGYLAPDISLKNIRGRMHQGIDEICQSEKHHLFLFVGKQANITKIGIKGSVISSKFKDVLEVHLVLLNESSMYPDLLSVWIDEYALVHNQYSIEKSTAILIRPDKYIALTYSPVHLVTLQSILHELFT